LEHGTPTISDEIDGMSRILILDTGFSLSILQRGVSRDDVRVTTMKPYGVTAEILDIKRQHSVSFVLNGREFSHAFPVCSLPTEEVDLLGTDVMERAGAVIDFECGTMSLTGIGKVFRVYSVPPTGHTALAIFSEGKPGRSPQSKRRGTRRTEKQFSASPCHEMSTQQNKSWLVGATKISPLYPGAGRLY
jgi:hypothetical protein